MRRPGPALLKCKTVIEEPSGLHNYGLEFLDYWISQMNADVLAANAVHAGTKVPAAF